jgi:hypothetical protein
MGKFDAQYAAFIVAACCFWFAWPLATKRIPYLARYGQGLPADQGLPSWRGRFLQVFWVLYLGGLAAHFSHLRWTMRDSYRASLWFAVFIAVATLALIVTRLLSWALRKKTEGRAKI